MQCWMKPISIKLLEYSQQLFCTTVSIGLLELRLRMCTGCKSDTEDAALQVSKTYASRTIAIPVQHGSSLRIGNM